MAQEDRSTLKSYFNTGDIPTEAQFANLIDSFLNLAEDTAPLDASDIGTTVQAYSAILAATTAAFTTALLDKLNGIEALADVTDATNVNAAGAVMNTDYNQSHSVLVQQNSSGSPEIVNFNNNSILGKGGGDISALTAAEVRSIINVEDGATADQSAAEIKTAYESNADTNAFTDAEQTKLAGIAAGAEVNTIESVTAGEPTGSDVVPNVVKISQADHDAASSAGTLVATTLYIIT